MYPTIVIAGDELPTFSILLCMAFFSSILYYCFSCRYSKLIFFPLQVRFVAATIGAMIGGKSLALVVQWHNLTGTFFKRLVNGGFVFYGGLVGGTLGLWIGCTVCARKDRLAYPFLYWADLFASILPLGQAIGRIGCFFNGCCYGKEWNGPLGILYPVVNDIGDIVVMRVFPTWFVESVFCLCLFFVLRRIWGTKRKYYYRTLRCGDVTAVYLLAYSVFRFLLEFLRGDAMRGLYGWISTSQIISLLIMVVTCILLTVKSKYDRRLRS